MADGMVEGGNGGNGRTAERMAEWQNGGRNGRMADRMAEQREWMTEWSNGGNGQMAVMADGMVELQTVDVSPPTSSRGAFFQTSSSGGDFFPDPLLQEELAEATEDVSSMR